MRLPPPPPRLSPGDAERLLLAAWGLEGRATPLPSYAGANHRVETPRGAYLLRVENRSVTAARLAVQAAFLERMGRELPGTCPSLVPTRSGRLEAVVVLGTPHRARLLTWVPGRTLARAGLAGPNAAHRLGAFLGRLARAMADFDPGIPDPPHPWDIPHARWVLPHLALLADPALQRVAAGWLERHAAEVAPVAPDLPHGGVHGDANEHNVVLRPGGGLALIDFEDARRTARLFEPAIAAAYAIQGQERPAATLEALLAGYTGEVSPTRAEWAALPASIAARLCVSVVSAALERRRRPRDAYVATHEATGRAALARLATTVREAGLDPAGGGG